MTKNRGKGKERREIERVLKDPLAKKVTMDLIALICELTRGGGIVLNATVAILNRNGEIHLIGDPEFVSEFQDSMKG